MTSSSYDGPNRPSLRILSEDTLRRLHFATLEILERTGVAFESPEAVALLSDNGAAVSNHNRVKIPSHLVERALRSAPRMVTLYSREGDPAIVLNGLTGSHFGSLPDPRRVVDLQTGRERDCYVEDIAEMSRLIDSLDNIEWTYTGACNLTLPVSDNDISDKVALLQFLLNSSKPIVCEISSAKSLREMIDVCTIVSGSEETLRSRPFFGGSCEPVSPLVQGRDALEKSLLCAEKGLPVVVYGMPMAGTTAPATAAGCLAIANAEVLSHLVVLQLKNPGTPVIYGSIPSIMDMRTMIYSYGAPELTLMVGALTELCHWYGLPMFGTAGCTDSGHVDAQAGAEITYQILVTMLTGADLVHDVGVFYHAASFSPDFLVLADELIEMARVLLRGIDATQETLALDLIERLGPRGTYLTEEHTYRHFKEFWAPRAFDRSFTRSDRTRSSAELLRRRALDLVARHEPKPLSESVVSELKAIEKTWLTRVGLTKYPGRP